MKNIVLLLFFILAQFSLLGQASTSPYWKDSSEAFNLLTNTATDLPTNSRLVEIDLASIQSVLNAAPQKRTVTAQKSPITITLPLPNYRSKTYQINQSTMWRYG